MLRASSSILSLLAVVALLAIAAAGQDGGNGSADGPEPLIFESYSVGEEYWFFINNKSIRNPTLTLEPGQQVEVTLHNKATIEHNLRFGVPIDDGFPLLEPSRNQTMRFTVPEDAKGEAEYWCEPHRELGMFGTIRYGEETGVHGIKLPLVQPLVPILGVFLLVAWLRQRHG